MTKREIEMLVDERKILNQIFVLRGKKVMLDENLAALNGVETRRLNEQVKRNLKRFPKDFMFSITKAEYANLKSQNATSSWGGRRKLPMAFTEQGVAKLEKEVKDNSKDIANIFSVLRELLEKQAKPLPRNRIGCKQYD